MVNFGRHPAPIGAVLAAFMLAGTLTAAGQPPASAGSEPAKASDANASAPAAPPMTPEQARQARLLADTARLYKLAQELKVEVDKSSKDMLSVAVVKKAAEVEQLARDLKERMKAEGARPK